MASPERRPVVHQRDPERVQSIIRCGRKQGVDLLFGQRLHFPINWSRRCHPVCRIAVNNSIAHGLSKGRTKDRVGLLSAARGQPSTLQLHVTLADILFIERYQSNVADVRTHSPNIESVRAVGSGSNRWFDLIQPLVQVVPDGPFARNTL